MTDDVVLFAVRLRHEHVVLLSVPPARPVLVRPADAERKTRASVFEQPLERALEQALAVEPVVVEAEPVHPVALGQGHLLEVGLSKAEIVEPQVRGQTRLKVPLEVRACAGDVPPLREALPPPDVILRDGMELREIEGNDPRAGQVIDLRLMAAGKFLLITCYRSNLERGVEVVGRHAEMMDDRCRRLVDDPEALLPQLKAQIHVLAVCRREVIVEPPELP